MEEHSKTVSKGRESPPNRSSDRLCFLAATIYVIEEITDYLPSEGVLCLLLTCMALYNIRFHLHGKFSSAISGSPSTRAAFCLLLERDLADKFYLCQHCDRLHRFCPDRLPYIEPPTRWWHVESCPKYGDYHHGLDHLHGDRDGFPSYILRLVTDRHVYIGEAGLPLSVLEWKTDQDQQYLNAQKAAERRMRR